MNVALSRIRLAGCAALLAGCVSPQNTRFPTLGYNPDSRAERQTYTYFNPIPERETGPTIERPRFYEFSRPEPRRSQDRAAITDEILNNGGANVGSSPSASRYPQSVTP